MSTLGYFLISLSLFQSSLGAQLLKDLVRKNLVSSDLLVGRCCLSDSEVSSFNTAVNEGVVRAVTAGVIVALSPLVDSRVSQFYDFGALPSSDKSVLEASLASIASPIQLSKKNSPLLAAALLSIVQDHLEQNPNHSNLNQLWAKVSAFVALNQNLHNLVANSVVSNLKQPSGQKLASVITKCLTSALVCPNQAYMDQVKASDSSLQDYVYQSLRALPLILSDIVVQAGPTSIITVNIVANTQLGQKVTLKLGSDNTVTLTNKDAVLKTHFGGVALDLMKSAPCPENLKPVKINYKTCPATTTVAKTTTVSLTKPLSPNEGQATTGTSSEDEVNPMRKTTTPAPLTPPPQCSATKLAEISRATTKGISNLVQATLQAALAHGYDISQIPGLNGKNAPSSNSNGQQVQNWLNSVANSVQNNPAVLAAAQELAYAVVKRLGGCDSKDWSTICNKITLGVAFNSRMQKIVTLITLDKFSLGQDLVLPLSQVSSLKSDAFAPYTAFNDPKGDLAASSLNVLLSIGKIFVNGKIGANQSVLKTVQQIASTMAMTQVPVSLKSGALSVPYKALQTYMDAGEVKALTSDWAALSSTTNPLYVDLGAVANLNPSSALNACSSIQQIKMPAAVRAQVCAKPVHKFAVKSCSA